MLFRSTHPGCERSKVASSASPNLEISSDMPAIRLLDLTASAALSPTKQFFIVLLDLHEDSFAVHVVEQQPFQGGDGQRQDQRVGGAQHIGEAADEDFGEAVEIDVA